MKLAGAPFSLEITEQAFKQLERVSTDDLERVQAALKTLCADGSGNLKPLKGELRGLWRLRVGSLRAIFALDSGNVRVIAVVKREDAYRK